MFPRLAHDVRFDAQDWQRTPCHDAESLLSAGKCALLASSAGHAGVLFFLLIK